MTIVLASVVWGWQLLLSRIAHLNTARAMLALLSIIAACCYSAFLSPDHELYRGAFQRYGRTGFSAFREELLFIEPFFLVIVKNLYAYQAPIILFFAIFAATSIILKYSLIVRASRDPFVSSTLYFSYFFLIHDSTQIRASVAIAVLYWAAYLLALHKKLVFVALVLVATAAFHYSSIFFLPFLFLTSRRLTSWLLLGVLVSAFMFAIGLNVSVVFDALLSKFGSSVIGFSKLAIYKASQQEDGAFNPLGLISLISIAAAIIAYRCREQMNDFERLCLNGFILSIIVSFLLYDFGAIQTRVRAMYSFSLVFIAPLVVHWLSDKVRLDRRLSYSLLTAFMFCSFLFFSLYRGLLTGGPQL